MEKDTKEDDTSWNFTMKDSFILKEFTSLDDFLNTVDERVNIKIAQGMKKALQLVVESLDKHIKTKLKIIIQNEMKEIKAKEDKKVESNDILSN